MSEELVTYLRLSPEFGGTRFGPFEDVEIALGSDADRSDITLPSTLGVFPQHVKVLRQADSSMIVSPVERTATVFLWKAGARRPQQINAPTAVRPGDGFSLVTEDGPRFTIELDELPPEIKAQREKAKSVRAKRLSGKAFSQEGKRQVWTTLLVTGPGQMAQRAFTFIRSGTIFQPRYIFLGVAIAGGYVLAGFTSCKGKKNKVALADTRTQLTNCEQDLDFADSSPTSETANFPHLVSEITDSTQVGRALEEDDALRSAVIEAAKVTLSQSSAYEWLLFSKDRRANRFANWRELLLDEQDLDPDFILVAPYFGVEPGNNRSPWSRMEDSTTTDVCTRGIASLTYRQALHLGMVTQLDALISSNLSEYQSDQEQREAALKETLHAAGGSELPLPITSTVDLMGRGRRGCVYVEGEDDRTSPDRVITQLVRHVGMDAAGLPSVDSAHSVSARVAKFYAADIPDMDFRSPDYELDFSDFPASTVLNGLGSKGEWVLDRTAEVFAKAVVLPCEARLQNPGKEAEQIFGTLPDVVPCLVLNYRLHNDDWQ